MTGAPTYLSHAECPGALEVLSDLLDGRERLPSGYEPDSGGAWVAWETLTSSPVLSNSELAVVHMARGCALGEWAGGIPFAPSAALRSAVLGLTDAWTVAGGPRTALASPERRSRS